MQADLMCLCTRWEPLQQVVGREMYHTHWKSSTPTPRQWRAARPLYLVNFALQQGQQTAWDRAHYSVILSASCMRIIVAPSLLFLNSPNEFVKIWDTNNNIYADPKGWLFLMYLMKWWLLWTRIPSGERTVAVYFIYGVCISLLAVRTKSATVAWAVPVMWLSRFRGLHSLMQIPLSASRRSTPCMGFVPDRSQ